MAEFTPFPFLGQGQSPRTNVDRRELSFKSSLDSRGVVQFSGLELVPLAWMRLVYAFTGETDITFAYARICPDKSLDLISPHVHLLATTTLAQASEALASADHLTVETLESNIPSLLIEGFDSSPNKEQFMALVPLQIHFQVHTDTSSSLQYNIQANFDADLLSGFHVECWLRHLEFEINLIAEADSNLGIAELPHLSPADVEQITQWNSTPQTETSDTIHHLIFSNARQYANDRAIDAWDGSMTYEELDMASNNLAQLLSEKGMSVGDTSAIMMQRSIQVPVAMLAVLKAGGAFILFDAKLPLKRLQTMQIVTDCRYAIASSANVGLACRLFESVVVICDNGVAKTVERAAEPHPKPHPKHPAKASSPHDTAFLIFTSGSTGVPKAVEIQHYAWCSTYSGQQKTFGITRKTRVLQRSSFNFVLSCMEILATLMIGGTVCIPGEHEQQNDLAAAIRRLKPEWVSMTPSLAGIYRPEDFAGIDTLVLVGELVSNFVIKTWTSSGELKLLNGYGQSEACSMNSTTAIDKHSTVGRNIGQGTWLRYWVVSPMDHNELSPVGAVGELLVEGYAIAKGYRNNDEQTKKSFISNPTWAHHMLAGQDGRRFYKTGDLVQFQEDGSLCLFGRKDAQLKVRGQRMEAAEVEHHIMTNFGDEVEHTNVEKVTPGKHHKREHLTAYIVLKEQRLRSLCDEKDLISGKFRHNGPVQEYLLDFRERVKTHLSVVLPDWMIPTSITLLRTAPKTTTGKLSRRLLQEQEVLCSTSQIPEEKGMGDGSERITQAKGRNNEAPTFPTIEPLSQIWAKTLYVDDADVHPNQTWTSTGGDSLNAMSFVREARGAGFQISFVDVYSGLSLAELAKLPRNDNLVSAPVVNGTQPLYRNAHIDEVNQLPLTDFQAHCINTTFNPTQTLVYKYDIRFRGRFDPERLERALGALVKNTDSLRLKFEVDSLGDMKQSVVPWSDETMQTILAASHADDDTEKKRSEITQPVFAKVIKDPQSTDVVLFLRLHHAVFDGTSLKLLLDDLVSAYVRDGQPNARPSYWTYLKNRLLPRPSAALNYWRRLLAGSSPTMLRVPAANLTVGTGAFTDTSRTGVVYLGTNYPPAGATMSTLLKGAWAILLSHMANTTDVIFEYLVHGRDENVPGSQDVIGTCVNNVPCRLHVEEHMTGEDLLSSAGRQILENTPYANIGSVTVARECTDWGFDGRIYHYSSWLLHLNIDVMKHAGVGDAGYMDVPDEVFGGEVVSDFAIITAPFGRQAVKILLLTHSALYTPKEIQAVWDAFLFSIHNLSAGQEVGWIKRELGVMEGLPAKKSA